MIPSYRTNFLYLADTLQAKYSGFYNKLEELLQEHQTPFDLLPGTKDVWARDYMPVQVAQDKFIRFNYDPSYLRYKKYENKISDAGAICKELGIDIIETDIIVDGGNVVCSENKVIMTDRVFDENKNIETRVLIGRLKELFETDHVYFIPRQPGDFTGHADGMVRFINDDTILIHDYVDENPSFRRAFELAINNTGLNTITIPYHYQPSSNSSDAKGIYMNYLEMENLVILPVFDLGEKDVEVLGQFTKIFSDKDVVTILSNDVAKDGGILNCISWPILR